MITVLIVLGLFLLILLTAAGIMKTREIEQENRLLQSYMHSMEMFYEGLQNRIEAARQYRHDLAKHIQTLQALLEEEENDGVKDYMEDLKQRYDHLKNQEFCSDELVNSILNLKQEQCRERGIPLYVRVQDCIYSGIEEVDMVGLLHNLLDNAIEANERIPREEPRGIWFFMEKEQGKLTLKMKNCLKRGEKFSFKTQEAEKEEHGIGTRIIQSLVEKYQGTRVYTVNTREGVFEDEIRLKCGR